MKQTNRSKRAGKTNSKAAPTAPPPAPTPAPKVERPLPDVFRFLNLYPLVFDPELVGEETDLEGHAFALEVIEHAGKEQLAYVVKTLRETRALDPVEGGVVLVPAGVAVRVVCTPAMHRLRPLVESTEAVPHLLFRGVGGRLRVAEGPSPIKRADFEPPSAARAA